MNTTRITTISIMKIKKMNKETTYYIYHIPGKKIGVTTCPETRVEKVQGYQKGEYNILHTTNDINKASELELTLQKAFKYKVDEISYKKLTQKPMKFNVTEMTTTFPCPVNKLKGRLIDMIGTSWSTDHGSFHIDEESIKWIMSNVQTSKYNTERCYVYNKAFSNYYNDKTNNGAVSEESCNNEGTFGLIRTWARERGIYDKGDSITQYAKLQEEAGELARALLKRDRPEIIDSIGDIVVVLTNLAELENLKIEECTKAAYDVIASRTGKMVNGTFVKSESL